MSFSSMQEHKFTSLIESGLYKISSIIESNVSYDEILGNRIKSKEYSSLLNSSGKVDHFIAYNYIINKLYSIETTIYETNSLSGRYVITYGTTKNNLREIAFFFSVCKENEIYFNSFNVAELPLRKNKIKAKDLEYFTCLINAVHRYFGREKSDISLSLIHQFLSFFNALIRFYDVFQRVNTFRGIVANDHSPFPVAFHKVASFFDVPVCYIQHAEVTENFPNLDFDFSILRNKISKDVYNKKKISSVVKVIDRDNYKSLQSQTINEHRGRLYNSDSQSVYIYISSVYNKDELLYLFNQLIVLRSVNEVVVKLHPETKNVSFFQENNIKYSYENVKKPHVAICGNSSVVIELISAGCLVYQYFSLDDIDRDYYGFYKEGLSLALEKNEITECFWKNQDDILINVEKWANFSASENTLSNVYDRYTSPYFLTVFFGLPKSEKDFKKEQFLKDLFFFFESLMYKESRGCTYYDKSMIVKSLDSLFERRDSRLNSLYKNVEFLSCSSIFEFWFQIKIIEWTGFVPKKEVLSIFFNFLSQIYSNKIYTEKLIFWIEKKIFDVILRNFPPDVLLCFLASCKFIKISDFAITSKIQFINYIHSNSSYSSILRSFYDQSNDNLSELDRLKIDVQCNQLNIKINDTNNAVLYAEGKFLESHPIISREYNSLVKPTYDKIRGRDTFLNVRFSKHESDSFISLVETKLSEKKGFSFLRLGDGEGFIFQSSKSLFNSEDSLNRQRHWWGEEVSDTIESALRTDLIASVLNSDVIGIPTIYRFIRDHSAKTTSLCNTIQGRGLVSVLQGINEFDDGNFLYADNMLNTYLLNSLDIFSRLSTLATKVILINSGSYESVKEAFSPFFNFEHIQIPTHNKTAINNKYFQSTRSLPYIYKEIERKLSEIVIPGALVLVGAGLAGKSFMNIAKLNSAVGLDVGSAMDQIIGGNIHSLH